MKIAVTYNNGQIFQHFGHTETFKVYQVEDGKVASSAILDSSGSGHGALASLLRSQGVDALICGGFGGGSGSADQAVADLLAGKLTFNPDVMCSHHGEHHGHDCGEHHGGQHDHHCGGHCGS